MTFNRVDKPWDGMKKAVYGSKFWAGLKSFHHRPVYGEYNEYIHYIMNIYIIDKFTFKICIYIIYYNIYIYIIIYIYIYIL